MAGFQDFGNGTGYLYLTTTTPSDAPNILTVVPNTNIYAIWLLEQALTTVPSSGEILSVGNVTVTNAGGGTITTCTVNGVDIMGASAATGATTALLAASLANLINTKISSPDYTAVVVGSSATIVQITALPGTGSTPNGFVVSSGVSGGTTVTTSNMAGGVNGSGVYSPVFGQRFYINSNVSATPNSLTGAVEITSNIAKRGLETELYTQNLSLTTNIVTPVRIASISYLVIDSQGGAGTDTLNTINPLGFQNGDILIISGANASHIITLASGAGNINLLNSTNWATATPQTQIMLQYLPSGSGWYEITRSATLPNVAALRAQSVAVPIQGVNSNTMGTSGTTTFTVNTDKYYQIIAGSPVLVGNIAYAVAGGTLDGDTFEFDYRATPTTGGTNTVTIGNITLTDLQATSGNVKVTAIYRLSNTTWYYTLYPKTNGIDVESVAHSVATYQPLLPASGGDTFVLQKTIAGALSFVPNGGTSNILTATVTIPAGSVLTLNSVPYTIIPALGSGLGIEVVSATAQIKTYGTTPYATHTALVLQCDTATSTNYQAQAGGTIITATAATTKRFTIQGGANDNNPVVIANKALVATILTGDPTAGDSAIVILVAYRIISL